MSKAFKCDLCGELVEDVPDQELVVKPKQGTTVTLQACPLCAASLNDWRVSRAPTHERPRVTP